MPSIAGTVETWPRLAARDYLAAARACLKYDVASRPLLFRSVVFPLIRSKVQWSPAAKGLAHITIETAEINPNADIAPVAGRVRGVGAEAREHRRLARPAPALGRMYRRRLGHRMVGADTPEAILAGSCFTNFPVIVPQDRCADIARAMMLAGYDVGRSLYPNAHRHPKFTSVRAESDNVDNMVASIIYCRPISAYRSSPAARRRYRRRVTPTTRACVAYHVQVPVAVG